MYLLYANAMSSESAAAFIFEIEFFLLVGLTGIFYFTPMVSIFTVGFTPLFFLCTIHFFTSFFVLIWFEDFVFIQEVLNSVIVVDNYNSNFNYRFSPQIIFTVAYEQEWLIAFFVLVYIGFLSKEESEDFIVFEEQLDSSIVEDIVAPLFVANLGKNIIENGALYLKVCAIFSFVLISNLLGRIPYGDTATSSLILTFWVAFSVFAALVTLMIKKNGINYFFSLFIPSGCPLALIFLLIPIEFLSYSFRCVSLSVRLFANIIAGHTLIKVLIGFSYVRFTLGEGYAVAAFLPAFVVFILIFLERAVAGIQAYIFTILTCIYLKDLYMSH